MLYRFEETKWRWALIRFSFVTRRSLFRFSSSCCDAFFNSRPRILQTPFSIFAVPSPLLFACLSFSVYAALIFPQYFLGIASFNAPNFILHSTTDWENDTSMLAFLMQSFLSVFLKEYSFAYITCVWHVIIFLFYPSTLTYKIQMREMMIVLTFRYR